MLITLSRRTTICQSVAEVWLTAVAPLGAVSHRFNFFHLCTACICICFDGVVITAQCTATFSDLLCSPEFR